MIPHEDKTLPVVLAPAKYCPRKLKPTGPNVKRYMSSGGPLVAYMISCPACGFVEMHFHDKVRFVEVEVEGVLVLRSAEKPMTCMACQKQLTIYGDETVGSFIAAKSEPCAPS